MSEPNFETAWSIYSAGDMPVADAFDLAEGIQCLDGEYTLNACPNGTIAALLSLGDDIFELGTEAKFARRGAYRWIRDALEALYPEMHCSMSDPWTFDTYSDLYKDDHGFRPRGHITGADARRWIKQRDVRNRHGDSLYDDAAYRD